MSTESNNKNEYAKHVSLFLAELLRTRKIGLDRAAEIAQKVVQNINLIDNEHDFLQFVKELTHDFDELFPFEERVHLRVHSAVRKDLELKIRAYAVSIMTTDLTQALNILQEAIKDEIKVEDLCQRFPKFKQFVEANAQLWMNKSQQ